MTEQEEHLNRESYFNARYWKIAEHWFKTEERTELRDQEDEADRRCRFCGLGEPQVTFKKLAHALPDFLGNLSIISMNECDDCKRLLGQGMRKSPPLAFQHHQSELLQKCQVFGGTASCGEGTANRPTP